jgi:hypothetical protein
MTSITENTPGVSPTEPQGFTYKPFNDPSSSIRLLKVRPFRQNGLVEVEIQQSHDDSDWSSDPYMSLSYVWGESAERRWISLNGHRHPVRVNLFNFLQVASVQFADQNLWIDALCINQDNLAEKNHQVRRMATIYKSCECVLVWLGIEPQLRALGDWLDSGTWTAPLARDTRESLKRFCHHPYWTRVWITQEFLLAPIIHIVSCPDTALVTPTHQWTDEAVVNFPWSSFLNAIHAHSQAIGGSMGLTGGKSFSEATTYPWGIDAILAASFWPRKTGILDFKKGYVQKFSLRTMVAHRGKGDCVDTRDRIYGILAILRDKWAADFEVDYTEDVISLFWRLNRVYGNQPCNKRKPCKDSDCDDREHYDMTYDLLRYLDISAADLIRAGV